MSFLYANLQRSQIKASSLSTPLRHAFPGMQFLNSFYKLPGPVLLHVVAVLLAQYSHKKQKLCENVHFDARLIHEHFYSSPVLTTF